MLAVFGFIIGMGTTPFASATIIGGSVTGGSAKDQGASFYNLGDSPAGLVIGNNTIQNPNLYGFNEDQNIILPSDLALDIDPISISTGLEVASHYIFFDPAGDATITGWVDFDSDILGIITQTTNLAASDYLMNNDVTYLNPGLRGLENNQDLVWIDPLLSNRLSVSFRASSPGDYIRVITKRSPTAEIPEPATFFLISLGLLGIFYRSKSRDQKFM